MKYWDASALVSLLVDEPGSQERQAIFDEDHDMVTWWGSVVECASALNRIDREGRLEAGLVTPMGQLRSLAEDWLEVAPTREVRQRAFVLLRLHPLRAADAFQLAAALTATANNNSEVIAVVCSDERLSAAARLEGFRVL